MSDPVARPAGTQWHTLSVEDSLSALGSDASSGISGDEARMRLDRFGPNRLIEGKKKSAFMRFLQQFNDFMIWVLLAAVVISAAYLREFVDALVIMIIVILNALLGFVQESRAERAIEELKTMGAPLATVIRNGVESTVPAESLVPGDLVMLETGDIVPADARLITAVNLKMNESTLTGESVAVDKDEGALLDPDAPLGDRFNMVFSGTHVEYGRGTALVTKTGRRTQLGEIAAMLGEKKPGPTPLQVELRNVGKRIVYICLFVVAIVLVLGVIRGHSFQLMFLFAVSLAVAAIPEGLPAIVTITLSTGTRAMAKQNAIIRNLPAVETLGSANYICSDKTGTLTMNRMKVTDILFSDGSRYLLEDITNGADPAYKEIFKKMSLVDALCNDARPGQGGVYIGDPTEVALLESAELGGVEKGQAEQKLPRTAEIPFDSDRKMMTTIHRDEGGYLLLSKGAVEAVLEKCDRVEETGGEVELSAEIRAGILDGTRDLASQALRTIGTAYRRLDSLPQRFDTKTLETGMVYLGTLAMKDPPRPEALPALETCRRAHIDVAMITGDHRATAEAVGRELSIMVPGKRLIEGRELEKMSPEELQRQVENIAVYARVSPRDKVKIVEALKERGHIVAMTGDGVNDAPALQEADIGVAMGITGTDVAKEASDMILADDNFATIVAAVRQGRVIFSNLKKFIYFLLSCNISEVLTMFTAVLFGWPLPLVPAQILWINLVTDGLPALALGVEPPEKDVMENPPRRPGENILSLPRQGRLFWQGLIITAGAVASFLLSHYLLGYSWQSGHLEMSQTVVFTTMVLSQVFHSYNWRFENRSFFGAPPWQNLYLLGSFLISIALQLFVLYAPFMQKAFHTHAPSLSAWILILTCALVPVLLIDRIKAAIARWGKKEKA